MVPLKQIPAVLAIFLVGSLSSIGYGQADPVPQEASDPKGAIIIASIEGKVTVTNNTTGAALAAPAVVAGKILFDGHTIKTGPNGKIILLFSTGTVTTLKADSTLNIKKFTQGKIPAGTNLNTIKEEPSASDVLIDLNVGDMVVDIKKLKKESSFDIDSPVGTAGIRGTRVGMNIRPAAGGGWMSKITVPRGAISFTPLAILGAPPPIPVPVLAGQAVAPAVTDTGAVAAAPVAAPAAAGDLAAINADLDDAGAAANNAIDNVAPAPGDGPDAEDAPEKDGEEEAPSEEEINEEDDERQAASKGVDDENSSSEAVALDKAGLIDLDDPSQLEQVETFVEVTDKAATMFKSKQDEETSANSGNTNAAQRRAGGDEESESESFLNNLIKADENGKLPLADVVDVTESAQSVGANDDSTLSAVLDNAEKADDLKVVIAAAEKAESKDKDTLGAVLRNAEQGDKLAAVVATAEVVDADSGGASTGEGGSAGPVGEKQKKKLDSLFKVVKQVDEVQVKDKKKKDAATAATAVAKAEGKNDEEIAAAAKAAEDAVVAAAAEEAKKEAEEVAKSAGKSAEEIVAAGAAAKAAEVKSVEDSVGGKEVDTFASDIFTQLEDVVDLTETATEIGTDAGFGEVLKNADKADKLVTVVKAAKGVSTADDSLAAVLKSADKAVQMEEVVASENAKKQEVQSKLEAAQAAGEDVAAIEQEIQAAAEASAKKAKALFKVVKKVDDVQEAVKAAPDTTPAEGEETPVVVALNADDIFGKLGDVVTLTETATTVGSEAGFDSVLENAKDADKLLTVVEAAQGIEGADDSLAAVLKSADKAVQMETVVAAENAKKAKVEADARAAGKSEVEIAAEIKTAEDASAKKAKALFNVVKKVDTARDAQKLAAETPAEPGGETPVATAPAVKVDDVFNNFASVVDLADKASDIAGDGGDESLLENVLNNADQANELKEMVEKSETVALAAKAKAEVAAIAALGAGATEAEKAAASSAAGDLVASASLTNIFDNAAQVTDLKEMIAKSETVAAAAKAKAEVDAIAALGAGATEAEKAAASVAASDLIAAPSLTNIFDNAAQVTDLKAMVAKSEAVAAAAVAAGDTTATADVSTLFLNADKATSLKNVIAKAEEVSSAGGTVADIAGLLGKADKAVEMETVVKQLDTLGFEGDQATDIFANIETVADVLADVTTVGSTVNAEVAKNLLGNAKGAKQMQDALAVIKEASAGTDGDGAAPSLAALENIVKKDVKELEAINNVAKKLKESGEGGAAALEAFVSQNIDKAAQLDKALEGNADLAGEIAAQAKAKADADTAAVAALGEGATEEEKAAAIVAAAEVDGAAGALNIDTLVDASALGSLKTDYAGTDYLSVLEKPENADKADDIAFALSFIKSGKPDLSADETAKETANEAAFFANIDKLDDLIDLGLKFEDDPTKMDTIFNNLDRLDALKELSDELAVYPDRIKLVFENADKADALLGTFKDVKASGSDTLMDSLFASKESLDSTMANQGLIKLTTEYPQYGDSIAQHGSKAAEIAATAEDFKGDTAKLDLIFGNLDKLDAVNDMTARYGSGSDADKGKLDQLFENFDKLDDIKKLSDRLDDANLDGAQDRLFENIDRLDDFETGLDVFTEAGILKQFDGATAEQVEMIFDIGDAFDGDVDKLKVAGSNMDKLADLKALAEDKDLDAAKLDLVFANPDKANAIKDLNDAHGDDAGSLDVVFGNLDMIDDFEKDSGLLTFAKDNPEDFETAKDSGTATENLSSTLLNELKELGLSGEELKTVLADLNTGPAEGQHPGDAPTATPVDPNTVSLLANHEIKDNAIDANLVLNAELALASSFFKDVAQVYDSLSSPSDTGESISRNFRVFGGKNVFINAGNYDIGGAYGGPGKDDFLIAATDKLTIAGNAAFRNTDETMASTADGLILLSAGSVSLPQGNVDQHASVSYGGDMLGIGSMETLNVINVDLQAEGEVSLRSLDSLVINNSTMKTTNGNGADFVHLRALDEINANGLLFSANVQKIVMDAMTINLANVTFPGGSTVNLNSALGPLDNKYPTFGSQNKAYGRVNFINDVRYGQHLLNSRSAFDTHGGSITIGAK